jgi:NADP-dependent 3-hydroxy acid dehydrogenase YdfG
VIIPVKTMSQNGSFFDFSGKVAVITGGSTGIGRATAILFARHEQKL